jgi:hypothetical protein
MPSRTHRFLLVLVMGYSAVPDGVAHRVHVAGIREARALVVLAVGALDAVAATGAEPVAGQTALCSSHY